MNVTRRVASLWFTRGASKITSTAAMYTPTTAGFASGSDSALLSSPAFSPTKVGNVWRKASVSPKNVARLLKEQGISKSSLVSEDAPKKAIKPPKGHKVDRLKKALTLERQAKMAEMDARIAAYRKKKREAIFGQTSALDRLVLTKRALRLKARGT